MAQIKYQSSQEKRKRQEQLGEDRNAKWQNEDKIETSSNISERESLPESVGKIENEDEELWSSLTAKEGGEFISDAEEQRPG